MHFSHFQLPNVFTAVLEKHNIIDAYPIQEEVIPPAIAGRDIIGIAKTGSGKTLAYVLPILTKLNFLPDLKDRQPQVLILVPTRELAAQVLDVFKLFIDPTRNKNKTVAVFGGSSINPQMQALSGVKILIATPGRLLDLMNSNAVKLDALQMLIIDEADKMLNEGFKEELNLILKSTASSAQKLLFSATLSPEVVKIEKLLMKDPFLAQMVEEQDSTPLIQQTAYAVNDDMKGPFLRYLIKSRALKQVLVFTSAVTTADKVADKLNKNGVAAVAIHSKKSQHARQQSLEDFKNGRINVLVTTDLLSRGIDIDFLPYVINYELPRSPKDFIHRIGRTGRAANSGEAISLISEEQIHHFEVIQKKMGQVIPLQAISEINLHGY